MQRPYLASGKIHKHLGPLLPDCEGGARPASATPGFYLASKSEQGSATCCQSWATLEAVFSKLLPWGILAASNSTLQLVTHLRCQDHPSPHSIKDHVRRGGAEGNSVPEDRGHRKGIREGRGKWGRCVCKEASREAFQCGG